MAGPDDRAAAPAVEHVGVGGQGQAALAFIRAVALEAVGLEDGLDLFFEIHRRRGSDLTPCCAYFVLRPRPRGLYNATASTTAPPTRVDVTAQPFDTLSHLADSLFKDSRRGWGGRSEKSERPLSEPQSAASLDELTTR